MASLLSWNVNSEGAVWDTGMTYDETWVSFNKVPVFGRQAKTAEGGRKERGRTERWMGDCHAGGPEKGRAGIVMRTLQDKVGGLSVWPSASNLQGVSF